MGSFNVACSVSNLSLGCGAPVAFFPLVPHQYLHGMNNKDPHCVGTQSMLTYSNCYFNPLSLPIFGVYNDYGTLEDIEKDSNTAALERFFNLPIEAIVEVITSPGRAGGLQ